MLCKFTVVYFSLSLSLFHIFFIQVLQCWVYIFLQQLYILFLYNFIYLFIFSCAGSLLLHRLFCSCDEHGLYFIAVCGLLIAVISHVSDHGYQACRLQQLWHIGSVVADSRLQSTGSVIMAYGLSCSTASGIFLDQGSNLCHLHWQVDLLPLSHQGSPYNGYILNELTYLSLCNDLLCVLQWILTESLLV